MGNGDEPIAAEQIALPDPATAEVVEIRVDGFENDLGSFAAGSQGLSDKPIASPQLLATVIDARPLELSDSSDLSADQLAAATRSTEILTGQVRNHLSQGSFEPSNGFVLGVEDDLRTACKNLDDEFRQMSGAGPDLHIVLRYQARLKRALADLASRQEADASVTRAVIDLTIERLDKLDGTEGDLDAAIEAVDALALTARWEAARDAFDGTDEEWDHFIADTADPYRTLSQLMGWAAKTDITWGSATKATALTVSAITAGTGFIEGASAAQTVGGVGAILTALIGATVWFMRARLQPAVRPLDELQ